MRSIAAEKPKLGGLAPFSLKDAPSFIEAQFPVGRISAEAYKERKAGSGQTLTALGSYWKGRKPLILVRAVILGCLLPATDAPLKDLEIFLKLMAMDDAAFGKRFAGTASEFAKLFPTVADMVTLDTGRRRIWRDDVDEARRLSNISKAFTSLPYSFDQRLKHVRRPEECDEAVLLETVWDDVNAHLKTTVQNLPELIEQLGIARFGHRPGIADTFCGGGSIPFEAARMGCDVYASDLNPIACMLTWGAFNIIGAKADKRAEIQAVQNEVATSVDAEITALGIEHDKHGNRAKAYLYCLETRCPKTGWMVPMAPSWVISRTRNVVAKLVPDVANKRYNIEIHSSVSEEDMSLAELGTIRDSRLVHPMNPERSGVELKTIRGDFHERGSNANRLRMWEKSDFIPKPNDIWQERLYCIQWSAALSQNRTRPDTFFESVDDEDLVRERLVERVVQENLEKWQIEGFVPDMVIEPGEKTDEPIRTRGWTYWHHLFSSRQLLVGALLATQIRRHAQLAPSFAKVLDYGSRLCRWDGGHPGSSPQVMGTFTNQALNPLANFGVKAFSHSANYITEPFPVGILSSKIYKVSVLPASSILEENDIYITDPPYADAINYHEITEFFIAWLRKNPPIPFDKWIWDSRRSLAIKGKDEEFRREMVTAYSAMTRHMSVSGIQVVMFTHQNPGVWADLGAILWAAGLRVTGAWNIVTETTSALKEGNYVQGTVCLVLRKRITEKNARRMEIEAEIEEAVAEKLANLNALDEAWPSEALYTDGDLTLAAYAAALQVVTGYSTIDRQPLDRDLYRKLEKGERSMIRDLVEYAAQIANGLLVPTDFPRDMWRDLLAPERFYVRMLDMEAKGSTKVADFQNFARSFAFNDYTTVMSSTTANAAALAGAADFKGSRLDGDGFFATQLRQVLFAIWKTMEKNDPKLGVITLRTEYSGDYWQRRQKLVALAGYVAAKTQRTRPAESAAAHELAEALKLDRV